MKTEGLADKYCYLKSKINLRLLIKSQTIKNQLQINLLNINNELHTIQESI